MKRNILEYSFLLLTFVFRLKSCFFSTRHFLYLQKSCISPPNKSKCSKTPCWHTNDSCAVWSNNEKVFVLWMWLTIMCLTSYVIAYLICPSHLVCFPELPKIPSADYRYTLQILTESFRSFVGWLPGLLCWSTGVG